MPQSSNMYVVLQFHYTMPNVSSKRSMVILIKVSLNFKKCQNIRTLISITMILKKETKKEISKKILNDDTWVRYLYK